MPVQVGEGLDAPVFLPLSSASNIQKEQIARTAFHSGKVDVYDKSLVQSFSFKLEQAFIPLWELS